MKYIDILLAVDKSRENYTPVNVEKFCQLAGVDEYSIGWNELGHYSSRLKSYWIDRHLCTDTWVGTSAVYLDDVLVGVTTQVARKSDYDVKFISEQAGVDTIEYIRSLVEPSSAKFDILSEFDQNEEFTEFFTVAYYSQLLDNVGIVNGKPAKFIAGISEPSLYQGKCVVEFDGGFRETILISEFKIPLKIVKS